MAKYVGMYAALLAMICYTSDIMTVNLRDNQRRLYQDYGEQFDQDENDSENFDQICDLSKLKTDGDANTTEAASRFFTELSFRDKAMIYRTMVDFRMQEERSNARFWNAERRNRMDKEYYLAAREEFAYLKDKNHFLAVLFAVFMGIKRPKIIDPKSVLAVREKLALLEEEELFFTELFDSFDVPESTRPVIEFGICDMFRKYFDSAKIK